MVLLLCVVAPLAAIPIAYGVSRYLSAAELDRTIAALRENGEPTTVEELNALYPTSPESERATSLWFAAVESAGMDAAQTEHLREFVAWIRDPGGRYVKQFQPYWPTEAGGRVTPEAANLVDQFLAGKEPALQAVRQAVAVGGTTRFLLDDERESSVRERWESYGALFNLLRLECERRRIDGDAAGVAESIRTILAFAEMLREEPDPVLQSFRQRGASVAAEQMEKALLRDELPDADLADLQKRFGEIDYEPSLRGMSLVNQLRQVRLSQGKEDVAPHFAQYRFFPESNAVQALKYHATLVEGSGDYDAARKADAEVELAVEELAVAMSNSPGFGAIAAFRHGEAMSGILEARFVWRGLRSRELWNDLTETAIAVARWRRAHGELPPDLGALVPEYLESIPIDVEIDEPILYRATEKGYVVYSRGYDREDHGAQLNEAGFDDDWPLRIESDRYAEPPQPKNDWSTEFGIEESADQSSESPAPSDEETPSAEAPDGNVEPSVEGSPELPDEDASVEAKP